jgi:UDP-N-acetylmuramoyl-tripeptide--D-alanyl-D-alanine ligase
MRGWTAERVAEAAGASLLAQPSTAEGPERVTIDSREAGPGTLFIGLPGSRVDGGEFAGQALAAGAWGVLARPEHLTEAKTSDAVILASEDPLQALQHLATAWRRHLRAKVIGVTGSTGKTTTKEILKAILAPQRATVASRANFNTEIGLPLEICNARAGTEILVLEMAMRGAGQIAELAAIAEPDVGVLVSVGPVHLELLGSLEAIAAAKSELIAALPSSATAVVPADEPLLAPHLRSDLDTVTFGEGGDVRLSGSDGELVRIDHRGVDLQLEVPFPQAHLRRNLLAAVAAACAIGVRPRGRVELVLSPGRGQRLLLAEGVTLIDDCYNANPMSMRAALDDLATTARGTGGRAVAILGDMLELGPEERRYHAEVGAYAGQLATDVLITVGPLSEAMHDQFPGEQYAVADAGEAAALAPEVIMPGDVILVKASRGVGLEIVCQALAAGVTA